MLQRRRGSRRRRLAGLVPEHFELVVSALRSAHLDLDLDVKALIRVGLQPGHIQLIGLARVEAAARAVTGEGEVGWADQRGDRLKLAARGLRGEEDLRRLLPCIKTEKGQCELA